MVGLFVLALLVMGGLALAAFISAAVFLLRTILWFVLLPFRLLMWALWIPIGIVTGLLGLAAGVVAIPVILAGVVGFLVLGVIAAAVSVMLPLVPFVLLGLLCWALFRRRPAAAY